MCDVTALICLKQRHDIMFNGVYRQWQWQLFHLAPFNLSVSCNNTVVRTTIIEWSLIKEMSPTLEKEKTHLKIWGYKGCVANTNFYVARIICLSITAVISVNWTLSCIESHDLRSLTERFCEFCCLSYFQISNMEMQHCATVVNWQPVSSQLELSCCFEHIHSLPNWEK